MGLFRQEHDADVYADGYQDGYLARDLKCEKELQAKNEKKVQNDNPKPYQEKQIIIGTLDKAKKVVNIASKFAENVDVSKGHYLIDAKSIMGLLSLDISQPVMIRIYTDDLSISNDFFSCIELMLDER